MLIILYLFGCCRRVLVRSLLNAPVILMLLDSVRATTGVSRIALVRLVARVLRFHSATGPSIAAPQSQASSASALWYELTQARLSGVRATMGVVYAEEKLIGRGGIAHGSFPHSHFCKALVDAALALDAFRQKYDFVRLSTRTFLFLSLSLSLSLSHVFVGCNV
jgi:hypothetical protein